MTGIFTGQRSRRTPKRSPTSSGRQCIMLVLFQRKVIYMPWLPPGSRDEPLAAVTASGEMGDMRVKEVGVASPEPTRWFRRPVEVRAIEVGWDEKEDVATEQRPHVVILYMQGEWTIVVSSSGLNLAHPLTASQVTPARP